VGLRWTPYRARAAALGRLVKRILLIAWVRRQQASH